MGRDESPASRLNKLEALVVGHYGQPVEDVRFIASILSIPCQERYGTLSITPQRHKEETLRALVDLVAATARPRPSLMLFEDLHWVDPTTLDALALLIARAKHIPLLLVLTSRPEFQSPWSEHEYVTVLTLAKLTQAQSRALVLRLTYPFDTGLALTLGAQVFDYCGEPEQLLRCAEEAIRVGREHCIPLMSEVMAQIVKGVAWLRAGRVSDSISQLQAASARLSRTGHRAWVPYIGALRAEALARSDDLESGLVLIAASLAQIESQEERSHLAEILRLKGWMLGEQGKLDEAEHNLRAALNVAR